MVLQIIKSLIKLIGLIAVVYILLQCTDVSFIDSINDEVAKMLDICFECATSFVTSKDCDSVLKNYIFEKTIFHDYIQ